MRHGWIVFAGLLLLLAGVLLGMTGPAEPSPAEAKAGTAGLGMMLLDSPEGVSVLAVRDDSAAERAGIHPTDLLTRLNGVPFSSVAELETMLQGAAEPDIRLYLIRRGDGMEICFPGAP